MRLLLLLLSLPFLLLSALLSPGDAPPLPALDVPAPPPALTASAGGTPAPPWLEVARSLLFWGLALATLGYLLRIYLKDHPTLWAELMRFRPGRFTLGRLLSLWRRLWGSVQAGLERLPRPVRTRSPAGAPPPRRAWWRRPATLSPRERILYYYLSTLKRAEGIGLPRPKHQTPAEFAPALRRALPDAEAEIDLLTEAFIHARYSSHPPDAEHAALAKTVWQRIRAAFKNHPASG